MSLVALLAPGSSLMHVDCMLEPLGPQPSGSVCLVHQLAFTEVPVTALDPTLRDLLTVSGLDAWCVQWFVTFGSVGAWTKQAIEMNCLAGSSMRGLIPLLCL